MANETDKRMPVRDLYMNLDGTIPSKAGELFCCCEPCPDSYYNIVYTLDWGDTNNADLDAYLKHDSFVCYYGSSNVGGMTLNQDAHPVCNPTPTGPEVITGSFMGKKTFHAWYDQYSNCAVETVPTYHDVYVTNTGASSIWVNGVEVLPGNTSAPISAAYAGYATGSSPGFTGGTQIDVDCVAPP